MRDADKHRLAAVNASIAGDYERSTLLLTLAKLEEEVAETNRQLARLRTRPSTPPQPEPPA